jgi:hypothetical protein
MAGQDVRFAMIVTQLIRQHSDDGIGMLGYVSTVKTARQPWKIVLIVGRA